MENRFDYINFLALYFKAKGAGNSLEDETELAEEIIKLVKYVIELENKVSNFMKFCGCSACEVKRAVRKFRHETKRAIRRCEDPPMKISVSYTD